MKSPFDVSSTVTRQPWARPEEQVTIEVGTQRIGQTYVGVGRCPVTDAFGTAFLVVSPRQER